MACRTARDKRELLRVVRTPDGRVLFDPAGKAPGRGAYVCCDAGCVDAGLAKGRLAAALEARIEPAVAEELRTALREACQA